MTPRRNVAVDARCIIYTRVSTARQASAEKASLDDQLRRCRALAADLGHQSPTVWEDPGRSGTDPRRLEELVNWCEAHPRRDGLVVVWSPDRFARIGSEVVGYYTVRLRKAGWDLRYVDMARTGVQMVDGVTGALRAELAAEESRIKKERSLMGGRGAAERGRWNGGPAPYGYEIGPEKRLVPGDASEVRKVREAFAAYAKGATLEAVARGLGVGRRGKAWNPSGARALLANPAYVGTVAWGRRKGSRATGAMENAHEPLITSATWDKTQARLHSPNPRYAHGATRLPPAGALPYVLSKLVRCTCGDGRRLVGGGGVRPRASQRRSGCAGGRTSARAAAAACSRGRWSWRCLARWPDSSATRTRRGSSNGR